MRDRAAVERLLQDTRRERDAQPESLRGSGIPPNDDQMVQDVDNVYRSRLAERIRTLEEVLDG